MSFDVTARAGQGRTARVGTVADSAVRTAPTGEASTALSRVGGTPRPPLGEGWVLRRPPLIHADRRLLASLYDVANPRV